MGLFRKIRNHVFCSDSDSADSYRDTLERQWKNYLKWRDEQKCVGCGAEFKGNGSATVWVTEEWCGCNRGAKMPDTRPSWESFKY